MEKKKRKKGINPDDLIKAANMNITPKNPDVVVDTSAISQDQSGSAGHPNDLPRPEV